MKLIVGLGNPWVKYQNNRHNVGWHFLDYLVQKIKLSIYNYQFSISFQIEKKLEAAICKIEINGEEVILAKPQTFMNESGRAVSKILVKYEIRNTNYVYVVHDDLDIRLGKFKIQKSKGPKLHNGVESIEKTLRTSEFWRMRIGVDNRDPENRIAGEKYVLQNFTREERVVIKAVFTRVFEELSQLKPTKT